MKRLLFLLFATFLLQIANAQSTSASEYNYITSSNGLLFDVQGSRTLKTGYSLTDLSIESTGSWGTDKWKKIKVYGFYRQNSRVALVVEFTDSENGQSYRCIPGPKSTGEIRKLSNDSFNALSPEWHFVLSAAFRRLATDKLL